jgi:hypothetical protein
MPVAEHDLNHAIDLHVPPIHWAEQGFVLGILDYIMYLAARLKDLNAFVFLLLKKLQVGLEVNIAIRFHTSDAEFLLLLILLLFLVKIGIVLVGVAII